MSAVQESFENESGESVKNLQQRKSYGIRFSEAIEQFLSANPRRRSPLFDALKGTYHFPPAKIEPQEISFHSHVL